MSGSLVVLARNYVKCSSSFTMSACKTTPKIFDIRKVDEVNIDEIVANTASTLSSGGVVALPTDTIYGLACNVNSNEGIRKLYNIKKRNTKNPVAICVAEVEDMHKWANITVPQKVLEDLFPGQVTAVFTRKDALNPNLNPDTPLVGIRIPEHYFIRKLLKYSHCPIALTSANRSGYDSTLQIQEFHELWDEVAIIIDGGKIMDPQSPDCRKGSTVINLSVEGYFEVIRHGRYHAMTNISINCSSYEKIVKTLMDYNIRQHVTK